MDSLTQVLAAYLDGQGHGPTAPGELREESRIVLLARQEGENAEALGLPHKETNIQRGIRITDTVGLILLNN